MTMNSGKSTNGFGKTGKPVASVKNPGRTPRQNVKSAQNILGNLKRRSANKTQVGF
jgi:hypothetical protein